MIQVYPAVFHPNEDSSITVTFPDLQGCVTEGKDVANAVAMARDALAVYLDTQAMLGESTPPASAVSTISVASPEYATLIDADPEMYARKRQARAIKRTISLPEWLDKRATAENVSLSRELQVALYARFGIDHE